MFPIGYFPDGYFEGHYFPHAPTGKFIAKGHWWVAGDEKHRLYIQALLAQEMERQQSEAVKRATLLAHLERQRKIQTFKEMQETEIRRCNVIAAYSVLFSEL